MGRKRTKSSPAGIRFEQALIARFSSIEKACQHYKVTENSIGGYRRGETEIGGKWELRFIEIHIDPKWVKTGSGTMELKTIISEPNAEYISTLERNNRDLQEKLLQQELENKLLRESLSPKLVETILSTKR